jgi:hypothetical protein
MLVLYESKRLTHECCVNEGISQRYVGKGVMILLSILTMGGGESPMIPTMGGGEDPM